MRKESLEIRGEKVRSVRRKVGDVRGVDENSEEKGCIFEGSG